MRLRGWRRAGLALILGVLATAAMPPLHLVPLLWVAFPMLLVLLEGCRTRAESAVVGWFFAFGHFATGYFWITNAFFVDAEMFAVFAYPAVGALCAAFALYGSLAALAVRLIPPAHEDAMPDDRTAVMAKRAVLFAAVWCLFEWWRGWFLSGFPWNPIGSVWTVWTPMIQSVAVWGTLGLSFITLTAASLFSVVLPRPRFTHAWRTALAPIAVLAAVGVCGWWRIPSAELATVPAVTLRLVQPNIAQADKWRPGLHEQHLMDYIRLSTPEPGQRISHVIWGESSVAFALDRDEAHRKVAASAVPPGGALIAGVTRAENSTRGVERIFNSLIVIDDQARVTAVYDKVNLVPFGEYLPLRGLMPFPKLTQGTMDFSPGLARPSLTVPGLPPFSPLICYEAVFSGDVVDPGERPGWLLNLTNDSWFGDSSGPHQHLAAAQLRAVEEGLPLIRVANTGISAAIDSYGRIIAELGLNQRGAIDVELPAPSGRTIFATTGQPPIVAIILLTIGGLLSRRLIRLPRRNT